MKIGFLGAGLMGRPMIRNLAAAGHDIAVWNRSPDNANAVADIASVAQTPAGVAADADLIIAMLADGPITENVLIGDGVIAATSPGAVIANMGSVEPDRDRRLAAIAEARGIDYLDAPVSGGVAGAEAATLAIMAGGKADAVERARPAFEAMGRVTHVGPSGAGQTVKLANQLIVATTIGAVAEAFKLAESAGCHPSKVREALRGGFAESRIMELHGQRMCARDFEPGGKSWSQLKDLRNALTVKQGAGLNLPLSDTVTTAYTDFVDRKDGGEYDHAAYYLWLEMIGAPKPEPDQA
ncbi:MAG: NAD(P)-dependent oxidoreductase [Pseudomonadota bacterium]